MKSKYEQSFYFGENGILHFFRIGILFSFLSHFCLSQIIYVSNDAKIYDSGNILKTSQSFQNGKSDIYILEGTFTSGLEKQSEGVRYIRGYKTKKTNPHSCGEKNIRFRKHKERYVSGRKEMPKQQALVYKPLENQDRFSLSSGKGDSAVVSSPVSSAKKYGITGKFEFEIVQIFSSTNQKSFFPENENLLTLLTAHTVRPPPSFCCT